MTNETAITLDKYNDVLSVKDLREILPVGRSAVYELVNKRVIKNLRVGSRILIPKTALIEFLQTAC